MATEYHQTYVKTINSIHGSLNQVQDATHLLKDLNKIVAEYAALGAIQMTKVADSLTLHTWCARKPLGMTVKTWGFQIDKDRGPYEFGICRDPLRWTHGVYSFAANGCVYARDSQKVVIRHGDPVLPWTDQRNAVLFSADVARGTLSIQIKTKAGTSLIDFMNFPHFFAGINDLSMWYPCCFLRCDSENINDLLLQ